MFDIDRIEAQILTIVEYVRRRHEDLREFRIAADVNLDS